VAWMIERSRGVARRPALLDQWAGGSSAGGSSKESA